MPVLAHAEPHEIRRPRQVLQPCVGRIARQPVVGDIGGDRDHARSHRQESFRQRADVAELVVHRDQPVVGGDDGHPLPRQLLRGELGENRRAGPSPGNRDQRSVARLDRAFNDKADVARDRIGELVQRLILPPFRLDHIIPSFLSRSTANAALVARIRTILQPLVRSGSAQAGNGAGHAPDCTSSNRSPERRLGDPPRTR